MFRTVQALIRAALVLLSAEVTRTSTHTSAHDYCLRSRIDPRGEREYTSSVP